MVEELVGLFWDTQALATKRLRLADALMIW